MLRLKTTRQESPWLGMTDCGQEQAAKHVKAAALDKATCSALPSLTGFDGPDLLLGRREEPKEVAVNERWFSDIVRGDATRLAKGQEHRLGEFRDRAFQRLKPRDLVLFLLRSQLIETYWHLEAELTMTGEEDLPDSYRAAFRGVHAYFTDTREESAYAFSVVIDRRTGVMTLVGEDVPAVP